MKTGPRSAGYPYKILSKIATLELTEEIHLKLSLNTGTFVLTGYSLQQYIKLASDLGFEGVELWLDRDKLWPRILDKSGRRKVKEIVESYDLLITSILPDPFKQVKEWKIFEYTYDVAHPDPKKREASVKFYNTALDVASDLEAEVMIALPGVIEQPNLMLSPSSYRDHWDRAIESLKKCAKHAEDVGVCLGIENAVVCNFVDRPDEMLRMVRQVDSEYVKAYLDVANANVFFPPIDYIETLRDMLASCIHVSDNDGSYAYHLPIGMGKIDYKSVVEALTKIGWNGFLVPEVFYAEDPEGGVKKSKEALTKVLT